MPAAKDNRMDLRLTEAQKGSIAEAAAISGRSITDFSVSVLVREAEDVIERDRTLRIDRETWDAFTEILERPAQSLDRLADLLRRPSVFEK